MINALMKQGKKFFLIVMLILLSACTDNFIGDSCISAYDFGYPKVTIEAYGAVDPTGNTHPAVAGDRTKGEYIEWSGAGLIYNNNYLDVVVDPYPYWVPYYGGAGAEIPPLGVPLQTCQVVGGYTDAVHWCTPPGSQGVYADVDLKHIPCAMTYGLGLYLLITDPGNPNSPNASSTYIKNPSSPSTINAFNQHLYSPPTGASTPGSAGTAGGQNNAASLQAGETVIGNGTNGGVDMTTYDGGMVYLKILDNFYDDNMGSFKIGFRSGAISPNGPFATIGDLFTKTLSNIAETSFKNIVKNPQYVFIVRAMLSLYITIMGVMFALGLLNISQKELLTRIFKFGIVSTLISDSDSWDFFNNYFFKIFTQGTDEVINMVTSLLIGDLGPAAKGAASSFIFFDQLMHLFFSPETNGKIISLLPIWVGIYMIPIIYFGIFYFAIVVCKTFVYFLTSLIAIQIILMLAPIFLCFMLFSVTKSYFEAWLKNLVSYCIQPILYIIALMMVALMVISEFQKIMGFQACFKDIIGPILGTVLWSSFEPTNNSTTLTNINVPNYGFFDTTVSPNTLCQPYECSQVRYEDLPFLDPNVDMSLITDLLNYGYGKSNHFGETLIFILLIFFGDKFLKIIPDVAKAIAGTPYQQADIKKTSDAAFAQMATHGIAATKASVAVARTAADVATKYTGVQFVAGKVISKLDSLTSVSKNSSTAMNIVKAPLHLAKLGVKLGLKIGKEVGLSAKDYLVEQATGEDSKISGKIGGLLRDGGGSGKALGKKAAGMIGDKLKNTEMGKKAGEKMDKMKETKGFKAAALIARAAFETVKFVVNVNKNIEEMNQREAMGLNPGINKMIKNFKEKHSTLANPFAAAYDAIQDKKENTNAGSVARGTANFITTLVASPVFAADKVLQMGQLIAHKASGGKYGKNRKSLRQKMMIEENKPKTATDFFDKVKDTGGTTARDKEAFSFLQATVKEGESPDLVVKNFIHNFGTDNVPSALRMYGDTAATYDNSANKFMAAATDSSRTLSMAETQAKEYLTNLKNQDVTRQFRSEDGGFDYNRALQHRMATDGVQSGSKFIADLSGMEYKKK